MIRVGFILTDKNTEWIGGSNYIKNLLQAIESDPDRIIEPVILTNESCKSFFISQYPNNIILTSTIFENNSLAEHFRKILRKIFRHDILLELYLKKNRIDVLSHSGYFGKKTQIPTIGWIPDFQHLYLPQYFNQKEIELRNTEFGKTCQLCSLVIFSSKNAMQDAIKQFPQFSDKYRVLHFVSCIKMENKLPSIEEISYKYNFKGKFFYLPNQFWIHKNHQIIIQAVCELKKQEKKILVISTGNTHDYRKPEYFKSLLEDIKKCSLADNIRILGLVPYEEVLGLLAHSIALINPSFFEGWSSTIEEAKSMGIPVIASDIPVHHEQLENAGIFFDPNDSQILEKILWNFWESPYQIKDSIDFDYNSANYQRILDFSKAYQRIVCEAFELRF